MIKYIWLKELKAELYTWKSTLWLLIASLIFSFTSYLLLTNQELSLLDQTELLWLLSKIIIGVAFLIVTIDASSIITTEFEKETAETLFVAPIRLRDFILGKLLASLTLWGALYIVAVPYMLVTSAGTNLAPAFLGYVALLGTLGVTALVMVIFAISFLYRSSKNTLTTSLVILLAFSIPALFSSTFKNNTVAQVFSRINPVDNIFESLDNVLVDYQLSLVNNWHYIWPLILFCLFGLIFMAFAARRFQAHGVIENS
jgi:ABC-type transport system involved in multi-copper enzyme maturation permease subunit